MPNLTPSAMRTEAMPSPSSYYVLVKQVPRRLGFGEFEGRKFIVDLPADAT
jgi:hypothetical protein